MIRPLTTRFDAAYFDGRTAKRHRAVVDLQAGMLGVSIDSLPPETWLHQELRFAADGSYGEPVRIEHSSGGTLVVASGEFMEALRQHGVAPGSNQYDLRSWQAILLCCVAIAILGTLLYVWGVRWASEEAVRFLPVRIEDRLGRSVVGLLAPKQSQCTDSEAIARLQPLVDRLAAAAGSGSATDRRFHLIYVNQPIVNALAAPGGYIVVYQGLLDQTQSAEEFAGVLAHEMQHVVLRHAAGAIGREFSGRALLSLMTVDSSGTPAAMQTGARLASLSYQRSDEEAADLASVGLLVRAGVSPEGLRSFLRRLQMSSSTAILASRYLSTHPGMEERVDALDREVRKTGFSARPVMSRAEWESARAVCAAH